MVKQWMKAFLRDQQGSTLAVLAVSMMMVVGFTGLAVDGGYLYALRSKLQATADAAALAGASQLPDPAAVTIAAIDYAGKNMPAANNGTVLTNADVVTGTWDTATRTFTPGGNPLNAVRVVTRTSQANGNAAGLFFARAMGFDEVDVEAMAIASFQPGDACIVALDPTAANALKISGNADVTMGCGVQVNSTHYKAIWVEGGNACLTASSISVAGDYVGICYNPTPVTEAPPMTDPLAYLNPPSYAGCDFPALVEVSQPTTLSPGVYCGGLHISADVDFEPGMYVLDGLGLKIDSNSIVTGDEVSFYLEPTVTGTVQGQSPQSVYIAGDSQVTLSAPTSGDYEGVLIYQDRNTPSDFLNVMEGGADMELNGTLYFPSTTIKFAGNGDPGGATSIVARMVEFTGNANFGANPSTNTFGGSAANGFSLVQ